MTSCRRARFGFLLAGLLAAALPAGAQEVNRIEHYEDWSVFADATGGERLCWVAAEAKLQALPIDPNTLAQAGQVVLVLFTTGTDELSMELRGAPMPDRDSIINVGGESFGLFFQDGWGWLTDIGKGPRVKELLLSRSAAFLDLGGSGYALSLAGFGPALEAAEAACR